ncbi:MAG: LPS-assembly protein LptD [Ferruginibacter sp.]|nr:LPS-assembly protein LptD [Ferruginibacter sp.]
MNNYNKGKAKYILAFMMMALFISVTIGSTTGNIHFNQFYKNLTTDTIPLTTAKMIPAKKNDAISVKDTIPGNLADTTKKTDTLLTTAVVDTFDINVSKDSLDAPVVYHADDSMVLDIPGKKILLYGKESKVKYTDNELTAPGIEFDQRTNLVTAYLRKDSTGKVISFPTFNQGDLKTVSDTIAFNMKSGKGLTKGTYTQQDEMYIYAIRIKKVDSSSFFAYKARFTTCNLDTPHFAFVSKKIKFINKKFAVTGPVHPEFEGVPVPIILPFGIYPLSRGRHSGLIAPTFNANEQFGLSLDGIGYYKVINDNWDVTTRGTIYSYGGYTFNISPRYYKRYRRQGNLSFDYQRFKTNFKGDPDYSTSKTFNIRWSHSLDTKSRPGVSFNANVNAGSSKFNSQVPNNPTRNFSNQLSSSIAYAKIWKDKPYNISINANHSQNTNLGIINVTLPDISFNLNTLYPLRRKELIGSYKWYENLGVALNSNVKSLTYFSDDTAVSELNIGKQIFNNLQWGGNHNVPITLSLPQLGPLQIAPSISYTERWFQQKFTRRWDSTLKKIDTSINKGFYSARDMSFGISMSSRIFGSFTFGKNAKVKAIRHEIRPSLSANYKPDMNGKYFYDTQIDTLKNKGRFNVFDNSLYGAFGEGRFGGLSFNIDNNIQMKVRDKKDTAAEAEKKVTLIDGLNLSGSYNFLADSFQLSTFSVGARSNLFDKISITASAILDPYQVDARGERIDKLIWRKKALTLGRLLGGNISMSTQFQGGDKSKKPKQNNLTGQPYNPSTGMPLDEYQTEAAYISNNPAEFADFSIPWSVSFSYSLRFQRDRKVDYSGYTTNVFQDINWNGTVNLTEKWQLGLNGFYNITQKELGTISVSIARELHCWQMAINVSPVGRYRFFNISISPKSGLLRDIKVNRTRYFYDL